MGKVDPSKEKNVGLSSVIESSLDEGNERPINTKIVVSGSRERQLTRKGKTNA